MPLTISIDDPLAEQLRKRATARHLSPEQAARELLGDALHRIDEEESVREVNRRRAELIRKSRNPGLTADESRELNQLQTRLDQHLEATDRQLLSVAEEFRKLAESLPDATDS